MIKRLVGGITYAVQILLLVIVAAVPLNNALTVAPHYRMFTNVIGGGMAAAGTYFPHDEFYDAATREVMTEIAAQARSGATIACETPALFEYYAGKADRPDLKFVSLSDPAAVAGLNVGDIVVIAKGRRYMSNSKYQEYLEGTDTAFISVSLMGTDAAKIYLIDDDTLNALQLISTT